MLHPNKKTYFTTHTGETIALVCQIKSVIISYSFERAYVLASLELALTWLLIGYSLDIILRSSSLSFPGKQTKLLSEDDTGLKHLGRGLIEKYKNTVTKKQHF